VTGSLRSHPAARYESGEVMSATGVQLGTQQALERVMARLERDDKAWVVGDVGSGRATLADRLAHELPGRAALVRLADQDEADAAIGGLYVAAAWLSREKSRSACWKDWPALGSGIEQLSKEVSEESDPFTLIILVPRSWQDGPCADDDDWRFEAARRSRNLLHGFASAKLRLVWITSRTMRPDQLGDPASGEPIALPAPRNATALLRTVDWGAYQRAADRLAAKLDDQLEPSPLAIRLGVGVVGLGGDVVRAAEAIRTRPLPVTLRTLAEDLVALLAKDQFAPCRRAIARLLLARGALRRSSVVQLTDAPPEHAPLIADCVAYGDELVRVSHPLRTALRKMTGSWLDVDNLDKGHVGLADYYAALDGHQSIDLTQGRGTEAWLEKVHHRSHVLDGGQLEHLPCREMYWKRGRYLSIVRRSYSEAARVYEACVSRFQDDVYGRHYWAYNLERAGRDRVKAEEQYREAVRGDPSNPWWNSRLVSFLLAQGRQRAARTAWAEALRNVDPDGERVQHDVWLADHLHYWVARGWLEAGSPADALEVLAGVPEDVARQSVRVQALRQRVIDAVEADAIGASVYPSAVPAESRWVRPRVLPAVHNRSRLERWYPGRVVSADERAVRIVYAHRAHSGEYETSVVDVTREDWEIEWELGPTSEAQGYVELGYYADGSRRVVRVEDEDEKRTTDLPLSYFDRWHSPALSS
jgi:tetratricopeptide (TPR) repeat protein